jgi:hypothetical protein
MDDALALFKSRLRGALIARGDADYDQARKLYNGMIDKHPLLIALRRRGGRDRGGELWPRQQIADRSARRRA